jgi:DNA-binding PadR family transcriptional regulator
MLADMGYINTTEKDGKKVYTITNEGKEYLNKRQDKTFGWCGDMMAWGNRCKADFTHHGCRT